MKSGKALLLAVSALALMAAPSAFAAQAKEIKIGFITTLSGPAGIIGKHMKDSVELALEQLRRAAQPSERILDLVRDVGREALDGVHARPQRRRHFAQRAGQIADLVAAAGEIRNLDAGAASARAFRRRRQPADRPRDGAGEVEGKQHRYKEGHREDADHFEPHLAQLRLYVGISDRQEDAAQNLAEALDRDGDVFLVGRLPLSAVTPDEIDRLLGAVLAYADENFDTMLRLGFGDSIKREWAWRVKRGESLANLRAFARFADPDRD